MVAPSCAALTLPVPGAAFIPLPNESPPSQGNNLSPPNPPRPTLTNSPNDQNNDELDSPLLEITPPSRDPPAKVAPTVHTTVELAERRRAAAWSKREVARLSAMAEEANGAGV